MDKLSFFKKGTSKICGSLDIHEALHDCLLFLQSFMPLNCILFGLFEPEIGCASHSGASGRFSCQVLS